MNFYGNTLNGQNSPLDNLNLDKPPIFDEDPYEYLELENPMGNIIVWAKRGGT